MLLRRKLFSLNKRFLSTNNNKYDVVVIGAGPGGYVAAIKAGQLGMKVACIEKRETLGGTCLNVGCIPSKALLNASHMLHDAQHNFKKYGVDVDNPRPNLKKMMAAKTKAVKGLTGGIEFLFKKNKVDWIKGFGKIQSANEIAVDLNDGSKQTINADNMIIATGSEPATIPNVVIDEKRIVSSTGALSLPEIPKKMVVIGAGIIGLELGSVWARLGTEVHVVEFLDRVAPGMDLEVAKQFQQSLKKQGLKFSLSTKVLKAESNDNGVKLTVQSTSGGDEQVLECDYALVATGRRPYTDGLGLDQLKIEMDGPFVKTNDHWQTNVKNIYAIGDARPGPMLAHKAEEEGIAAVEYMKTGYGHVNYSAIPGVVYTHPEVAWVGKTEEELKEEGVKYQVGKFPMQANSRARTNDDAEGLVKVLVDTKTDRILGVHMMCTNAGELISEAVLGMEYGASAEDIARTCHAHPTLSEATKEACLAAYDKPIHS